MSNIFASAQEHLNQNLPFAIWRNPNERKVQVLLQKDELLHQIQDFTEAGFAFAKFEANVSNYIPIKGSQYLVEDFETSIVSSDTILSDIDLQAKSNFETLVEKAQKAIEEGLFEKVVLSREEIIELKLDVFGTFQKLLHFYSTAFCSLWFHPKVGFWMGATPEQLLKTENQTIKTVALAGTQKQKHLEDVLWSNKEIQEQQFVTDYIVNQLSQEVVHVSLSKPYTFQAGSIFHIKTDIEALVNERQSFFNIVNLLHPTPAVCGLPKIESLNFLIKNEGYDRSYYSGFIGEMNLEESALNLFVNLRCMQIMNNSVKLYIGCGITKESNPELEFMETVNKSMTMKNILKIKS